MAGSELHIHRLRLPAQASAFGAQGMAARIEDALRVSSKPASLAHRHVLVRRLRLAAAPGASAQSLALLFERAWQRIAAEAQPIATAPASADAVWAVDATAARVALIGRWAQGGDTSPWFWAQVQGRAQGGGWAHRSAILMLTPLDDTPASANGAVAAVAPHRAALVRAALAAIAAHGALPAFVQEVDDAQAELLAAVLATDANGANGARRAIALPVDAVWPAITTAAGEGRRRLAAALQAGQTPSRQSAGEGGRMSGDRWPADLPVPADGLRSTKHAGRITPAAPSSTATDTMVQRGAWAGHSVAPQASAALPGDGLISAWAGLWLLLPLLLRQGLDDAETPLAALAATLHAACARFAVPGDETVRDGIAALGSAATGDAGKAMATRWLRRARIAALRETRLPLRRIAQRGGVAWVSATRIDIEFPLAAADVRIRRAGFDLDPGFLPWLGRIVHFHYL